MATMRPCISSSSRRVFMGSSSILGCESRENSWAKLTSSANIASVQPFFRSFSSTRPTFDKVMPKAMAESSDKSSGHGLPIDLRGRKRLNVLRRHIHSLAGALFNIVLHVQGPLIFYTKSFFCKSEFNPDNGAVVLMCVEVLTKVAGKSLFEIDSFLVGQALRLPASLFQEFLKLRLRLLYNPLNSSKFCEEYSGANAGSFYHVVNREFSVDLFAACCRLLSTVLRHHQSESEQCISLLEDSLNIMIRCLEAVENESLCLKDYFAWNVQEGIKCASFLRRIYEEISQQKLPGRCCSNFLCNYIWIYSGCGPLRTGIKREIDEALRPGIYALIDSCSSDDLQWLHTVLGEGPCRRTLASLQHDHKLYFRYEGKV